MPSVAGRSELQLGFAKSGSPVPMDSGLSDLSWQMVLPEQALRRCRAVDLDVTLFVFSLSNDSSPCHRSSGFAVLLLHLYLLLLTLLIIFDLLCLTGPTAFTRWSWCSLPFSLSTCRQSQPLTSGSHVIRCYRGQCSAAYVTKSW